LFLFPLTAVRAQDGSFDPAAAQRAVDSALVEVERVLDAGPWNADLEALRAHPAVPEWFQDAKFGIYFHWGVYSVPAFGNEWYPRNMHRKGTREEKHHRETWGDPSESGYHDFVPMFTAEHFDANEWAELFQVAGARFAGPVAEHHDGYALWASDVTPWNSKDTGPKRDITGELATALRARDIKLVATFHHARNNQHSIERNGRLQWTGHYPRVDGWPTVSEDPALRLLYGNLPRKQFLDLWLAKLVEVIDGYQPDLIWFDSWLNEIPEKQLGGFLAYYFNRAKAWNKEVVVTCKQRDLPHEIAVEDFEKGRLDRLVDYAWLTDDTISKGSWCYTENLTIKSLSEVLHVLIDIVSKNGCLLLNISPKADGTIPDVQRDVLKGIGRWLAVNGEAIYDTRPWLIHGEGPTRLEKSGHFVGHLQYGAKDVRYTRSKDGKTVYAIVLGWPEGELTLNAVEARDASAGKAFLLGHDAAVRHRVDAQGRLVLMAPELAPAQRPGENAFVFALRGFDGLGLHPLVHLAHLPELILSAENAVLDGGRLKLEGLEGDRNIGFWDDASESLHWLVRIREAGQYDVSGVFAAVNRSEVAVVVGDQLLKAGIPATGDWRKKVELTFGQLRFQKPGVYHLVLRPANRATWKAINVWQLELSPTL